MTQSKETINPNTIDIARYCPSFIKIKNSKIKNAGKGAFTKKKILKGTYLGHYMGEMKPGFRKGPYTFMTLRNKTIYSINATELSKSNWTRFMNCSGHFTKDENVLSFKLKNKEMVLINNEYKSLEGYIVFYASRDIEKGEELCYYYGDAYYKLLSSVSKFNSGDS